MLLIHQSWISTVAFKKKNNTSPQIFLAHRGQPAFCCRRKINTQFCSKHYTMPQLSPTHLIKLGECTWPNNSTAATLTGILELTRNELPCQRTKWDTVHEWTSSLKDLNNIHTQPIDESHWKFLRGEKDLIKTYYQ